MFLHPDLLSGHLRLEKARTNKRGMGLMAGPQLEMSLSVWGTILQSTVALQAPQCVQWIKRPCT
jgi:hypothetical protein